MPNAFFQPAIVLVCLIVFAFLSHEKKSLDKKGIAIAAVIGLVTYLLGGFFDFFLLIIFFIVADVSTKYARGFNKKKHEVRTIENIVGNSGASLIALFFGSQIGFVGGISAALADTLSSEIGLLSKKKPVLITSLKTVEPGTDGGISFLGCTAALLGGLIIALSFFLFENSNLLLSLFIVIAGFFGSIADSFLGALFERKGGLNNTQVNFFGSASGAIIAFLLSKITGF